MASSVAKVRAAQVSERFPDRISRRVTLFLALLIFGGLAVGGTSVGLATAIVLNHDAVVREYDHIARVDAVHATFHDLIFELQQVDSTGGRERAVEASVLRDDLFRALDGLAGTHRDSQKVAELDAERVQLAELRGLAEQTRRLTEAVHDGGRLGAADRDWLHRALHVVPRRVNELAHIHRTRIDELVQQSRGLIRTIVALFVVFLGLGIGLLVLVSVGLNRDITLPLRGLAAAAHDIAEGRLDARVGVRSRDEIGQLADAFNRMAERLQDNERSLQAAQHELERNAREAATLQERERLAREMHDGFAQYVALLNLKLSAALALPELTSRATALLREMSEVTQQAYQDVRHAIFGLRTFVSRGLGFEPALAEYLHEFSELNRIAVALEVADGTLAELPRDAEVQVVRIIQEALVNVRKHAAATNARIRICPAGDSIQVLIEDDGVGCEPKRGRGNGLHFGLQTMRERAEGLGGTLELRSAPGEGTRVIASIPKEAR
jgi:NarL family two-component system sensor histidine kinase LiaS